VNWAALPLATGKAHDARSSESFTDRTWPIVRGAGASDSGSKLKDELSVGRVAGAETVQFQGGPGALGSLGLVGQIGVKCRPEAAADIIGFLQDFVLRGGNQHAAAEFGFQRELFDGRG
jgi:hypothetical protein